VSGALDLSACTPFARGSTLRRVVAEPVTALLVQRALVMEVAHPKVAAGVDHHSGFRRRPLQRAWVTADAAVRLVFGDNATATAAARKIYRTHDDIHGSTSTGESYSAHEASLLTWVWATLVDTARLGHERWVRPLGPGESETYYEEALAFARFLGIPGDLLPPDTESFERYVSQMLIGDVLASTEECRRVATEVLWYRHWSVSPQLVRVQRALVFATLDPAFTSRLGLRPSDSDLRLGMLLDDRLSRWYPHLPGFRRRIPELYLALRRPTIGLGERLKLKVS